MNPGCKPLRKWYVVLPLVLVIAMACSCSKRCNKRCNEQNEEDVQEVSEWSAASVEIFNEDGKRLGTLKESEEGERLFWFGEGEDVGPKGYFKNEIKKHFGPVEEKEWRKNTSILVESRKGVPVGSFIDEVKQTLPSPAEGIVAVIYVRYCGAMVDFATRIDLCKGNKEVGVQEAETVFIVEGNQPIELEWRDEETLIIKSPHIGTERVYLQKETSLGVEIEYLKIYQIGKNTKIVGMWCCMYGITGLSAGMPEELLLRIAGWHQMKSGLWRSDWGYWDGEAPYGDDPKGRGIIWKSIEDSKKMSKKLEAERLSKK